MANYRYRSVKYLIDTHGHNRATREREIKKNTEGREREGEREREREK